MSRTKIVAVLMVISAVIAAVVDALNGGEFNFQRHFDEFSVALGGLGLFFLRSGVEKAKKE